MKLETIRRSPALSTLMLFSLATLTGWCVFNLQIISLVRLLQETGIEVLPVLMLVQAACSWLLLKIWGTAAHGSARRFFLTSLLAGGSVALAAHLPMADALAKATRGWLVFGAFFVISQLVVAALRMGIHVTFSKRVSILRNPQLSIQLSIAEESGFLLGVLCALFLPHNVELGSQLVSITPFLGAAAMMGILGKDRDAVRSKTVHAEEGLLLRMRKLSAYFSPLGPAKTSAVPAAPRAEDMGVRKPFVRSALALFFCVYTLKAMQWFGMAYGLSEASRRGLEMHSLFSHLSLIQAVLTLTILVASLRFSSKIPTWTPGFRVVLGSHLMVACVLALFPTPYLLMSAEVLRKVVERGFFSRSLQLLTSSLPEASRFETRQLVENWSTTAGTAVAGVLAIFVVQGFLPGFAMWAVGAVIAYTGFRYRRALFEKLCDFHVAHLTGASLGGVIQACYALGNPECRKHHAALTNLLERQPRPLIVKSVLLALGRMRHPSAAASITRYIRHEREDIQLSAVRALQSYPGHEINLVLLKVLREMVRSDLAIRLNVVKCLTQRLGRFVVPYLLELLDEHPDDRVSANAIEILGEIARRERDQDLMGFVAKFLGGDYPRRVRANAVVTLYYHSRHGAAALETFERLLTSQDETELDAACYIIGALQLSGHEHFVWTRSASRGHSNTTLLVALLRLGNEEAPRLLARWVAGEDDALAIQALVRLSIVPGARRAKVFYELIQGWPEMLDLALLRMRKAQRDFDRDRELIREEALRQGIALVEEEAWTQPLVSVPKPQAA